MKPLSLTKSVLNIGLLFMITTSHLSCSKGANNDVDPNANTLTTMSRQVVTIAGDSATFKSGFADGKGISALFDHPNGVAVDAAGNVYVADELNYSVRKISTAGVVTTLAGNGHAGTVNGKGSAASFYGLKGIAVDAAGNVYATDANTIRKITPDGVVTTFAGSATAGSQNGTGTAATFNGLRCITIDAVGNLYISDYSALIRKITPTAVVSTFVNMGASFVNIGASCITVDQTGILYISNGSTIYKISGGVITTLAGSSTTGKTNDVGAAASFNGIYGITVDVAGNVYVADLYNNLIRKVSPTGIVTTAAGSGYIGYILGSIDGTFEHACFYSPEDVAVDPAGNLYVADFNNNIIRKINFH